MRRFPTEKTILAKDQSHIYQTIGATSPKVAARRLYFKKEATPVVAPAVNPLKMPANIRDMSEEPNYTKPITQRVKKDEATQETISFKVSDKYLLKKFNR
jgi:hypothetical protein